MYNNNVILFAKSIFYWLNYYNSVSKSNLLLESSIRFPLVEYIERRIGCMVETEIEHPLYAGRKIDMRYNDGNHNVYVELKFLHSYSDKTKELNRYLADVIRLATIKDSNSEKYFILCGNKIYFNACIYDSNLRIDKNIPNSETERTTKKEIIFDKILTTDELYQVKKFNPSVDAKSFNEWFCSNYKKDLPNRICETKLVAKEVLQDAGYVVFIWDVS